ncbi:hypothetical protein F4823DRAFT_33927 [Ustulina deusta]|nr:hypothetical protein F4823DRAFT_33927 [Ustulina deusta]
MIQHSYIKAVYCLWSAFIFWRLGSYLMPLFHHPGDAVPRDGVPRSVSMILLCYYIGENGKSPKVSILVRH